MFFSLTLIMGPEVQFSYVKPLNLASWFYTIARGLRFDKIDLKKLNI